VALLGPSGCGKTTLLRIIAGLESADQGRVLLSGQDRTDQDVSQRGIGFVFQHYALFRHMTVFENVAFGLRVKPRRDGRAKRLSEVHDLLNWCSWLVDDSLSRSALRGQRQRIAFRPESHRYCCWMAVGALDASVRKDLRQWLRNLHHDLNVTSIFVTHDQEEAMEVASQVVVLNHGRIEQQGSPSDIYDHPANAFVSRFIGQTNIFDLEAGHRLAANSRIITRIGRKVAMFGLMISLLKNQKPIAMRL
jgi:sulfate transport system ATP-binding protein